MTYSQVCTYSTYTIPSKILPETIITLMEKPYIYYGHINNFRQPVAYVKLQFAYFDLDSANIFHQALSYYFADSGLTFSDIHSENDFLITLGESICALQRIAGIPVFDTIQITILSEKNKQYAVWIPLLYEESFHQTLAFMLQFTQIYLTSTEFIPNDLLAEELNHLLNRLLTYAPQGANSPRLLKAAYDQGIPWKPLIHNIFLYGYGRNAIWMNSTFTNKTSFLATSIAENKFHALQFLKQAGFSVPRQAIATSELEAVKQANFIGYPVVVKPMDMEGGRGVFAHLVNDNQVKKYFKQALGYSEKILIEKHIFGKDYRLFVLNGLLMAAVERIPASVVGDGVHSIHQLIEHINQQPERGNFAHSPLKTILVSEDSIEFLAQQGFSIDDIPALGKCVQINRIANISQGGMPVNVLTKVHPHNKLLAEAIANTVGLDLIGIDVIMPDIAQSHIETSVHIIEINAQPQLGVTTNKHIYSEILSKLLPTQGLIPVIVLVNPSSDFNPEIFSIHDQNIGLVKQNVAYLNGEMINRTNFAFEAGNHLLLNNTLDLLIYCIHSWEDLIHQGLPFVQHDDLYFCNALTADSTLPKWYVKTLFEQCKKNIYISKTHLDYIQKQYPCPREKIILLESESHALDVLLENLKN